MGRLIKILLAGAALLASFSFADTNSKVETQEFVCRQIATPANPVSGKLKFYCKNDDKLYFLDSAGTETEIGAGATADDTAYDESTWNGSLLPATKNVIRDKIETLVTGPASGTDGNIVRFDGATGKLVQNSTVNIDGPGNVTSDRSFNISAAGPGGFTFAPGDSPTFSINLGSYYVGGAAFRARSEGTATVEAKFGTFGATGINRVYVASVTDHPVVIATNNTNNHVITGTGAARNETHIMGDTSADSALRSNTGAALSVFVDSAGELTHGFKLLDESSNLKASIDIGGNVTASNFLATGGSAQISTMYLGSQIRTAAPGDIALLDVGTRQLYNTSELPVINFSSGVGLPQQTASTVPYLNASKELTSSAVTPTQLAYLSDRLLKDSGGNIMLDFDGSSTGPGVGAAYFPSGIVTEEAIFPGTDASYSIGDGSYRFTNLFLSGDVKAANIKDPSGVTAFNLATREITNPAGDIVLDPGAYSVYDNEGDFSVDWDLRKLYDPVSAEVIDWSSGFKFTQLTATTVPYLDASKKLVSSAVTPTQLGYVDFTSSGQTQINTKQAKRASGTFTGTSITPTSTQSDETFLYTGGSAQTFSTTGFGTISSLTNGYRCTVIGSDDTNTITIAESDISDGRLMFGPAELGKGQAITFEYNSTLARMVEISRNF